MSYGSPISASDKAGLLDAFQTHYLNYNPNKLNEPLLINQGQLELYYTGTDVIGFIPVLDGSTFTYALGKINTGNPWELLPINSNEQFGLLSSSTGDIQLIDGPTPKDKFCAYRASVKRDGALVNTDPKHPMIMAYSGTLLLDLNNADCHVLNGANSDNVVNKAYQTPIVELISGNDIVDNSQACPPNCGSSTPSLPWGSC